ncbi:MAG: bifunctional 5,10-methylenetetrahydrofolate dehydrogenase/5,10-methenyltetrahydrofolate cyclohydrolase [Candidatus Gracilibacteria bacterium]|nr:bifunctional 5,10-methylenetetrahydrofolate dehydrogenase/5,10-methenyltetrahydrofolate cyclohydrolase [Candidatus Gracilibacteria bacterium]
MIIDGKKMALELYNTLQEDIRSQNIIPQLGVVLVGNNPSSLRYVEQKKKWADFVGINIHIYNMKQNVTQIELEKKIEEINQNNKIDGYIVQLPLPRHINEKKIINLIDPKKDVDGFHPENIGKLMIGDTSGFISCTPAGIVHIINTLNIELPGKHVSIVGRSNIVGKPLAALLINAGATVTVCNSKTPNIKNFTSTSDIVIMATGQPNLLRLDMVRIGTTIIDVGFTVIDGKIYGDADYEIIEKTGSCITPVPGGVGPLTVAMLMKNTFKACITGE